MRAASANLASSVTLQDKQFLNEYYENFNPGNQLSFTIDTTNVLDPSANPDLCTVAILDDMGNELPATGGADEFLSRRGRALDRDLRLGCGERLRPIGSCNSTSKSRRCSRTIVILGTSHGDRGPVHLRTPFSIN